MSGEGSCGVVRASCCDLSNNFEHRVLKEKMTLFMENMQHARTLIASIYDIKHMEKKLGPFLYTGI